MAADTQRADAADSDRLDALRQALGGLLARFTADRDALMHTVQECEQRLEEVAARIEANHNGSQNIDVAAVIPELVDLKLAVDQLQLEHRHAEARTQATAQQAMARADEALRRTEALAADRNHNPDGQLARFTEESAATRTAVEECQARLTRLEADHRADEVETGVTAAQAMSRADEAAVKIEALIARLQVRDDHTAAVLTDLAKEGERLAAAVRECEQRIAAITSRQEDAQVTATFEELKRAIDRLHANHRSAESRTQAIVERVDEAVAKIDTLAAAQPSRDTDLRKELAGFRQRHSALISLVQGCEQRLAQISARLDASPTMAHIEETKGLIGRLQSERQQMDMRACAANADAMARADAAKCRSEELATTSSQITRELQALGATVRNLGANLDRLTQDEKRAIPAMTATVSALTQRVDGLQAEMQDIRKAIEQTRRERPPAAAVLQAPIGPPQASAPAQRAATPVRTPWRQVNLVAGGFCLIALGAVVAARWMTPAVPSAMPALTGVTQLRSQIVQAPAGPRGDSREVAPAEAASDKGAAEGSRAAETLAPKLDVVARIQKPQSDETAPQAQTQLAQPEQATARVPSAIVALEPLDTTACVVEPANHRVCLYRRSADGVAADNCYSIAAQVHAWPQWLVAGDVTPQRIRLVDDTGQNRLTVLSEGETAGTDVVRLQRPDFDALSSKQVAWHTSWVVLDGQDVSSNGSDIAAMRAALERWRQAWEGRQLDRYVALYSASFIPQSEPDIAHWRAHKRSVFERSGPIAVQIAAPSIFLLNQGNTAFTSFEQSYRSAVTTSRGFKVLRWQQEHGSWTIRAETVLEEHTGADAG